MIWFYLDFDFILCCAVSNVSNVSLMIHLLSSRALRSTLKSSRRSTFCPGHCQNCQMSSFCTSLKFSFRIFCLHQCKGPSGSHVSFSETLVKTASAKPIISSSTYVYFAIKLLEFRIRFVLFYMFKCINCLIHLILVIKWSNILQWRPEDYRFRPGTLPCTIATHLAGQCWH